MTGQNDGTQTTATTHKHNDYDDDDDKDDNDDNEVDNEGLGHVVVGGTFEEKRRGHKDDHRMIIMDISFR